MGTCNGILSSCYATGYAMESRCHLGKTIVYDTVSNLSWHVDLRSHPIANMIDTILADPWPPAEELGREVPEAVPQDDDCVVSFPFQQLVFPLPLSCSFRFCRWQTLQFLTADTTHRNVTAGNLEISINSKGAPGVTCLPVPHIVICVPSCPSHSPNDG